MRHLAVLPNQCVLEKLILRNYQDLFIRSSAPLNYVFVKEIEYVRF